VSASSFWALVWRPARSPFSSPPEEDAATAPTSSTTGRDDDQDPGVARSLEKGSNPARGPTPFRAKVADLSDPSAVLTPSPQRRRRASAAQTLQLEEIREGDQQMQDVAVQVVRDQVLLATDRAGRGSYSHPRTIAMPLLRF
jgi:hypothetical protein